MAKQCIHVMETLLQACHSVARLPEGECRRCDELRAGAPIRKPDFVKSIEFKKENERRNLEHMRAHFAPGGKHDQMVKAGEIDTAFEW